MLKVLLSIFSEDILFGQLYFSIVDGCIFFCFYKQMHSQILIMLVGFFTLSTQWFMIMEISCQVEVFPCFLIAGRAMLPTGYLTMTVNTNSEKTVPSVTFRNC